MAIYIVTGRLGSGKTSDNKPFHTRTVKRARMVVRLNSQGANMKAYRAREDWLARAIAKLRPWFSANGYEVPEAVRVSCGLPSGRAFALKRRAVGEVWASTASRDKHFEIFVSPTLDEPVRVLATLLHELVHVAVGLSSGHRGKFTACARAVGLESPWTATEPSDEGAARLNALAVRLGKYPHGSLDKMRNGKKKQGTRMIRASCLGCTYTLRATMTWLLIGIPNCPNPDCIDKGQQMEVTWPDADGEDEES